MELIVPGSRSCLVVGCNEPDAALWSGIYHVCWLHFTALNEGEAWSVEDSLEHPAPILMGTDLPPEVVGVSMRQSQDAAVLAQIDVGRDGVAEDRVVLRFPRQQARSLIMALNMAEGRPMDDFGPWRSRVQQNAPTGFCGGVCPTSQGQA